MQQRNSTLLLSIVACASVGLVLWAIFDKGASPSESVAAPTPTTPTTSTPRSKFPRAKAPSNQQPQSNRFTPLTDPSIRWQVRVDMLRRLDASTLNSTEINYLFSLLHHDVSTQQKEAWWVVLNEIMEQMRKQDIAPERFDQAMLGLIEDNTLDGVTRDYAIQHLSHSLKDLSRADTETRAEKVINALVAVIQTPSAQHNSMEGTTLMALTDLSTLPELKPFVDAAFDTLEPQLMPLIASENASTLSNRTSAINAVALLGRSEYLPSIRQIVSNPTSNDSAKLSAIAALGSLGEDRDQTELEQIASSHTKFKHAAHAALSKLTH